MVNFINRRPEVKVAEQVQQEAELIKIDGEEKDKYGDGDAFAKTYSRRKKARMSSIKKISEDRFMVDRISDLPDDMLRHILWFLPIKDAQKTTVLSKTWNAAYNSSRILKFCLYSFDRGANSNVQLQQFCNFVDESLIRVPDTDIQALLVSVYDKDERKSFSWLALARWLNFAISRNVKYLDVYHYKHAPYNKDYRYTLPKSLLSTESLNELVLFGCKFPECPGATCEVKVSLTKLHLSDVYIDEHTLHRLLSACCFLEDVSIENCVGFKNVKLAGERLTKINLVTKESLEADLIHWRKARGGFVIEAPNLRLIRYCGEYWCIRQSILKSSCRNLKEMTLRETDFVNDLFLLIHMRFPVLEKLKLIRCRLWEDGVKSSLQLQDLPYFRKVSIKEIICEE